MSITGNSLNYSFAGKRVLITGGGKGVGRSLVKKLYNDGATVFTIDKDFSAVEQLRKDFPNIRAEEVDLANWKETQTVVESFGVVDHLVNNAGINSFVDVLSIDEEHVDKILDVNLKSLYCTSVAVAKGMVANNVHGSIVNLASMGGTIALRGCSAYSVSKAGAVMLTKSLALELGKYNIRVNSVSPALINTPMFQELGHNVMSDSSTQSVRPLHRQPLVGRKLLEPDEVADSVLFLLSPLSSMATGVDFHLDGGILTC